MNGRPAGAAPVLDVRGLRAGYAMGAVIRDLDLQVGPGEVVAVLGRNGAGKSTLARAIMGGIGTLAGTIQVAGERAEELPAHRRARLGMRWLPQDEALFPTLTVRDHLELASSDRAEIARVCTEFPVLADRLGQVATTLSGGERRMLGFAQAVLAHPRLLVLDEPSEGVAPRIVEELVELIARHVRTGCAVLLMEQNLGLALASAARAYVLERGEVVDHRDTATLRGDHRILERLGL